MKKNYWLSILSLIAVLMLAACSSASKTTVNSSKASSESTSSSKATAKDERKSAQKKDVPTKRVGSAEYGYIDIPKSWITFKDLDGGDSIQYSDGTTYNIVTMNAYTKEKADIESDEEFTAETIANRIAYFWSQNKDVDKYWGAKSTVAGNEAFQVNVIMKSGQLITVWIFKSGDKVYLISVEGDADTLSDFVYYVEETWSLNPESEDAKA